jgi:hypothetical protein
MATYEETLNNLRDWSDRDSSILSNALVKKFVTFAADKAYRSLRIPALETTADFTVTAADIVTNPSNLGTEMKMAAPSDLIELIYIQRKGAGIVWNTKVDSRTFHDRFADKTSFNFYTRVGSNFLLHGTINVNDVLEVHYYRRLQALDAQYAITEANYLLQGTQGIAAMTRQASSSSATDFNKASTILYFPAGTTTSQIDAYTPTQASLVSGTISGVNYSVTAHMLPNHIANWLRDENERILLYGGLAEAYDYLEENELSTRFEKRFYDEIDRLNGEEARRIAKGGNISISFSANGLI